MRPSGLFWLWSGAVFNVEFLFYGTLIMTFGLTVTQAIIAILVANLGYAFLGLASLQGPKTGTTAFMVSRAPFGQNGNRLVPCSTGSPRSDSRSRASTSSSPP
jgi:nucleobase:cation symporter-1, NCS1 family